VLAERGKIALDDANPALAEGFLRRALDHGPLDRQIVYNMLQSLQRQSKTDEARTYSELLRNVDEDIKAVGRLRQEVLLNPHNADPRCRIGVIFLKNRQIDDAMHWFASALEVDSFHR